MRQVQRDFFVDVNGVRFLEVVVRADLLGDYVSGSQNFKFNVTSSETPEVFGPDGHNISARLDCSILQSFSDASVGESVEVPGM